MHLHFRFTTADAHRVRSRNLQRSDGKEPEEQPTQKQGEVCLESQGFLLVRAICRVRFPIVGKKLVHACQMLFDRPSRTLCSPNSFDKRFWGTFHLGCCNHSESCDKVLAVSPQCTHRGRRLTPVLRSESLEPSTF